MTKRNVTVQQTGALILSKYENEKVSMQINSKFLIFVDIPTHKNNIASTLDSAGIFTN